MMNFLKDWIIQYQNKFSVGGVETTIDRITGTVSQEGDTIMAAYLNEIQKNCIYSVNATRVIEGVLEIYDISIDGSDVFPLFNTQLLINFNETNTKVDPVLRWNGKTYQIRKNTKFTNASFVIGEIQKTNLVVLYQTNSLALVSEFQNYGMFDEVNVVGNNGGQDVVIPSSLPVGYEKVIRKTGITGVVNIRCADTNEKLTPALLTSLALNYEGDSYKLKKITSTLWIILENTVKQTWKNVTSSRTAGQTYTNTTGKSIEVSISAGNGAALGNGVNKLYVDGIEVARCVFSQNLGIQQQLYAKVKNGSSYYAIGELGGVIVSNWSELRN